MQHSDAGQGISGAGDSTTSPGNNRRRVALTPHLRQIEQWVSQDHSDAWIASALGTSASSVQSFRSRHDITRSSKHGPSHRVGSGSEGASHEGSSYEGVLEHGEGESGYGLWLDPAVADDPAFEKGFGGVSDVQVKVEKSRIVLTPAPDAVSADATGDASPSAFPQLEQVFGPANVSTAAASGDDAATEEGSVKFYDSDRGFGFVYRPSGHELFFHKTELENGMQMQKGTEVVYQLGSSKRGPVAKDVRALR